MLDADLKFQSDIAKLYRRFDTFAEDNIIGIGLRIDGMILIYINNVLHLYIYIGQDSIVFINNTLCIYNESVSEVIPIHNKFDNYSLIISCKCLNSIATLE